MFAKNVLLLLLMVVVVILAIVKMLDLINRLKKQMSRVSQLFKKFVFAALSQPASASVVGVQPIILFCTLE